MGIIRSHIVHYRVQKLGQVNFYVPELASHRPASTKIIQGELYEPLTHDLFEAIFRNNPGSAVHAGAFFGDMLPHLSEVVSGTVWAFEPVIENYLLAQLCCEANALSNVLLYRAALHDRFENLSMLTEGPDGLHRGGSSQVSKNGNQTVAGVTLDSMPLESVLLIHLDIEGHELSALDGARETLALQKPVVAIEDNPRKCASLLRDCGYELVGDIPGVSVWAHPKNVHLMNRSKAFFEGLENDKQVG